MENFLEKVTLWGLKDNSGRSWQKVLQTETAAFQRLESGLFEQPQTFLLVSEALGKRRHIRRLEMAAAAADEELGLSYEGDQGDCPMGVWEAHLPQVPP